MRGREAPAHGAGAERRREGGGAGGGASSLKSPEAISSDGREAAVILYFLKNVNRRAAAVDIFEALLDFWPGAKRPAEIFNALREAQRQILKNRIKEQQEY